MKKLSLKKDIQKWLASSLDDPIAKILMKNSDLSKVQLETFLIDVLAEKIAEKRIIYEEKAKMRLLKLGVSRGAFNRTLRQARNNIIRSMYTIILLGYLGIFESPRLEPYLELANKLAAYTDAFNHLSKGAEPDDDYLKAISVVQKELENGLKRLIEPKSMSARV